MDGISPGVKDQVKVSLSARDVATAIGADATSAVMPTTLASRDDSIPSPAARAMDWFRG